jgi:hypothetical protein
MNDAWLLAVGWVILFHHYYSLARRLTRSEGVLQPVYLSRMRFLLLFLHNERT